MRGICALQPLPFGTNYCVKRVSTLFNDIVGDHIVPAIVGVDAHLLLDGRCQPLLYRLLGLCTTASKPRFQGFKVWRLHIDKYGVWRQPLHGSRSLNVNLQYKVHACRCLLLNCLFQRSIEFVLVGRVFVKDPVFNALLELLLG